MNVKVVESKDNELKFDWTLPWNEFEKYIEIAYKRTRGHFRIDGFRKGKAPRHIIENFYGKGVFYEDALNIAIDENYEKLAEELPKTAVGMPSVDIKELESGKDVVMEFTTEVMPEIEIKDMKNLEIPKIEEEVTDEAVKAELENQRRNNQREIIIDERAAEKGDTVDIDFEGFIDGVAFEGGKAEGNTLEIGSGKFIPGFEEQIIGKNINDEFDITVTFPEDYHAEEYAGKEAVFKTKLNAISRYELPELDDDFASEVSEFETIKELEADIRKKLEERLEESIAVRDENNAVDALVKRTDFEVPTALIESQTNQELEDFKFRLRQQGMDFDNFIQYTGQTEDGIKNELRPIAEKKTRANIVLDAAAKEMGIEVTDADREEAIKSAATGYGMDPDKFFEMAKNQDITFMDTGILNKKVVEELMKTVKRVEVKESEEKKEEKEEKKPAKKTTKKSTKKADKEAEEVKEATEEKEKKAPKKASKKKTEKLAEETDFDVEEKKEKKTTKKKIEKKVKEEKEDIEEK